MKSSAVLLNWTSLLCESDQFVPSSSTLTNIILTCSPGPSHIVPVLVGDPALAKAASDKLLTEHDIYVQSINYPTVARGEERLRITVTPRHTFEQMDRLVRAVDQIFTELGINRLQDWKRLGGRAGVGLLGGMEEVEPMWNDKQLGIIDGTTPKTLKDGKKAYVDALAVEKARGIFNKLLGPMKGPLQATRGSYSVTDKFVVGGGLNLKTGPGVPLEQEIPTASPSIAVAA